MKKIRDRQPPEVHGRLWRAVQEKLNVARKRHKAGILGGAQLGHLPGDLIYKIFLLLPADSLHIASLVCKGWFKLIKSSYFIESHSKKSDNVLIFLQTVNKRRPRTFNFEPYSIFPSDRQQSRISYINFLEIEDGKGKVVESTVCGLKNILATCNGLILGTLERRRGLVVVNPATKKHISIPYGTRLDYGETYGLVFCHSTRDYKVVHLFNDRIECNCEIFSLVKRSWHAVDGPTPGIRTFTGKPVEVLRSLHWLPRDDDDSYSSRTLSLGVGDEKFFAIALPTIRKARDGLFEMRGCLALMSPEVGDNTIDIWILSGLIQGQDWEKKLTIAVGDPRAGVLAPVCTCRFGRELVFKGRNRSSSFYTYDLETQETRMVEMEDEVRCSSEFYNVLPHLNTLASWDSRDILS